MYRRIDVSMWNDDVFRGLPLDGKMLFIYLITNQATHVSGIYCLAKSTMSKHTGIKLKRIDTLCDTLSQSRKVLFDDDNDVVFVVKMLEYQGINEKVILSACKQLENLWNSELAKEFCRVYKTLLSSLSDSVLDRLSDSPLILFLYTVLEEKDVEKNAPKKTGGKQIGLSDGFKKFWESYPHSRRQAKQKCFLRWKQDGLEERAEEIVAKVEAFKQTMQWQDEKYVPLVTTWLNQKRWDTDIGDIVAGQEKGGGQFGLAGDKLNAALDRD